MNSKENNIYSSIAVIFFFIIALASTNGKSNIGKYESKGSSGTVSICRYCGLVVEFSYDRLYPDNKRVKERCNQFEGHMWYNAGTSGRNSFKCTSCGVRVSIAEKKPRCLSFCEEACHGKNKHKWKRLN